VFPYAQAIYHDLLSRISLQAREPENQLRPDQACLQAALVYPHVVMPRAAMLGVYHPMIRIAPYRTLKVIDIGKQGQSKLTFTALGDSRDESLYFSQQSHVDFQSFVIHRYENLKTEDTEATRE
jgi:hypothetical protein